LRLPIVDIAVLALPSVSLAPIPASNCVIVGVKEIDVRVELFKVAGVAPESLSTSAFPKFWFCGTWHTLQGFKHSHCRRLHESC
jgi:hypothetical protein